MSTVVDQRVVEMRFDNKQFEQGVSSTMSMLDKLKQSLNFKGLSQSAAKCGTSFKEVESMACSAGFSLRDVWLKTSTVFEYQVARKIVNSAKNMAKALTITPISTGFKEYETQMNAVQTILANTKSKGSTLDDVNKALDELNTYADKTIYNFTEMTRNIGTFTAAGVDLETSVSAIQGIANLAAVSGSTSQQASTAMYQLSQALSTGTVRLMDWNSVVNAGMGGEVFQNALKETSELLGTGAKAAIEAEGSFRESLRTGWLTSEVLTETLKKFTTSGANEYVAEYTGLSQEAVAAALKEAEARYGEADAIEHASKALAEKSGKNQQEIKEALEFAKTAEDAATKVKTFSQLWEVLQESAQSGWAQTWKLIVGDFEQAKSILSPLAEFLTGIINNFSKARNDLLQSTFAKNLSGLSEKIKTVIKPAMAAVDTVKDAAKAVSNLGDIVDKVIIGKFGNGKERFDALTKAGHNYYEVQNKVNEKLGNAYRYTQEQIDAQNKLLGKQKESTKVQKEASEVDAKAIAILAEKSEAELKALGYSDKQIAAFKELKDTADKLGLSIEDLVTNVDEINGRWLMIESFKNIGKGLIDTFKAISKAWKEVFPPKTLEERSEQLFNLLAGAHRLTSSLVGVLYQNGKLTDTGEKLVRTLKGVFAVLDIILTVVGGPLKLAFKLIVQLLGAFDLDVLSVTASISDAIVKFRDWIDSTLDFTKAFEKIAPPIENAIKAVRDWIVSLKDSKDIPGDIARAIGSGLGKAVSFVANLMKDMAKYITSGFKEVPEFITSGFIGGLWNGIKSAAKVIVEFAKTLIKSFCDELGIHSPSRVFFQLGEYTMEGLWLGIKSGAEKVWELIKSVAKKCIDLFNGVDFGTLLAAGMGIGLTSVISKLGNILNKFANSFEGLGSMFEDVGKGVKKMLKGIGASFKANAWKKRGQAVLSFALAIGVLAASVYVLTKLDVDKMWDAVKVIGGLAAIIAVLAIAIGTLGPKDSIELGKFSVALLGISGSLLILSFALKNISGLTEDQLITGTKAILGIGGLLMAFGIVSKFTGKLDGMGRMVLKLAIALLLMTLLIKIISRIDEDSFKKGAAGVLALSALIVGLTWMSKLAGSEIGKVGSVILKIAAAMLLLTFVAKLIAGMEWEEMGKAGAGILALGLLVSGLIWATKLVGKGGNVKNLGTMFLGIGAAILLMAMAAKTMASINNEDFLKAAGGIIILAGIIAGLIWATKLAGPGELKRLGATLLMMSISIGILAGVALLLSLIDIGGLAKGVAAVAVLGLIMAAMVKATRGASKCVGNIVAMTVAISVMVASVAILAMIDPVKLIGATLALGILMGMFALMASAASHINKAMGSLIVMTVAIALMGTVIYILAQQDTGAAMESALAISALLVAFAVALFAAGTLGNISKKALISLGVMLLVVAGIATIIWALTEFGDPQAAIDIAISLSILMLSLSAVCGILALVGMAGGGTAAIAGIQALITLIVMVGGLVAIIGWLANEFDQVETFITKGIPILEKIGYAIGSFVGNIIGGFSAGVTSGLPTIAENLSGFMKNLGGFITGAESIKEESLTGVKMLAEMMILLAGASIAEKIASIVSGGSSMELFATQIDQFATAIVSFSDKVKGKIDEESVLAAANAGKMLAEMQSMIAGTGGVVEWFVGKKDLGLFGSQLESFGLSIVTFSNTLVQNGGIDSAAIEAAASAGSIMAELQSKVVGTGGVIQFFTGEKNLANFGTQLISFGTSITAFSKILVENGGVNEEAVTAASTAGMIMAELQSKIVGTGGVIQFFTGEKNLADFGIQLRAFGTSIVAFSNILVNNGGVNKDAVVAAAAAGGMMAELQSNLEPMNGVVQFFTGKKNLEVFGTQIKAFGKAIVEFSKTVAGKINEEAVGTAAIAGRLLAEVQAAIPTDKWFDGKMGIDDFGKKIKKFGKSIVDYSEEVSGIRPVSISTSITCCRNLADLARDLKGVDGEAIQSFSKALGKISKTGVDSFVEAFENADARASKAVNTLLNDVIDAMERKHSEFTTAGETVVKKFGSGVESNGYLASTAVTNVVSNMLSTLTYKWQSFYDSGSYLVGGFAAGISANTWRAEAQAIAMANAAEQAARNALGINSPSKIFREIGMGVPEGFALGVDKFSSLATNSVTGMTDSAVAGVRNSIARIAELANSNIDTQPTIRPVLDLSSVRAGASSISGMLGTGASVGVLARVGSINSAMNEYRQNGANDDVVSAINKLGKDLENAGGNTTNINGITYDDGSNITSAVEAIVHAAKVGRRT